MMYLHAFQSEVWNLAASQRLEAYGLKVVKGDLVAVEAEKVDEEAVERGAEKLTVREGRGWRVGVKGVRVEGVRV